MIDASREALDFIRFQNMNFDSTSPANCKVSAQERDQRICKERRRERMEHLRFVTERLGEPDLKEEEKDLLREELDALSVAPRCQVKITMSWGGPSDGYLLTFDGTTRELLGGDYWYADWFTYAEEPLSHEEADMVCNAYLDGGCETFFPRMR